MDNDDDYYFLYENEEDFSNELRFDKELFEWSPPKFRCVITTDNNSPLIRKCSKCLEYICTYNQDNDLICDDCAMKKSCCSCVIL